jgi:hypothetical protein
MKRLCFVALLLAVGCGRSPSTADSKPPGKENDPPTPNNLTPKELADGAILLFDGETTFGWQIDGEAKVDKGVLKIGGAKPATARSRMRFSKCEVNLDTSWTGSAGPQLDADITLTLTDGTKGGKFSRQSWSAGDGRSVSTEKDGTRVFTYSTIPPLLGNSIPAADLAQPW